jgi:hypothetical protein
MTLYVKHFLIEGCTILNTAYSVKCLKGVKSSIEL